MTPRETREDMMNKVIARYGHESDVALWFCYLCESYPYDRIPNEMIIVAYNATMNA